MRVLPVAIAVSAALHGGAIAWVHTHPPKDTERPPPVTLQPIEVVPAPIAEPTPMVVALLDDHSVVTSAPAPARPSQPGRKVSRTAVAATQPGTTTLAPVETAPVQQPTQRNPLLSMRKPDLDPRALPHPADAVPEEAWGSEANPNNPRWIANATPEQITAERMNRVAMRDEEANRELKPDGTGKKSEHKTFRMKVDADGSARITDKPNLQRKGLGATFDVTDGLMRSKGIDPYASYKLKILDETREERVAMGKQHRTRQLAQSRQHMERNLERLWSSSMDLAARKRGLFELWDDCAESGSDELIAGGTAARAYVLGFIRTKLPAGSADAYTVDEIAKFNRQRRSTATFAPY